MSAALLQYVMITSTSNTRIKAARKLTSRKQRYSTGEFLVEGMRLVQDAWQNGITATHCLLRAHGARHCSPTGKLLLDGLTAAGVPCQACSPPVFAALTGTITPQGIVAVFPIPELALPISPTLVLILDNVRDPGNAGTLLRGAAAAGVDLVIFGPETVDPFNEKVVRAGMGVHFRLPHCEPMGTGRAFNRLLGEAQIYLADATGALTYDAVNWHRPAALVVGGEASGASPDARIVATAIRIPMHGNTESLNAAMAGSVILFEAARQRHSK